MSFMKELDSNHPSCNTLAFFLQFQVIGKKTAKKETPILSNEQDQNNTSNIQGKLVFYVS